MNAQKEDCIRVTIICFCKQGKSEEILALSCCTPTYLHIYKVEYPKPLTMASIGLPSLHNEQSL